MNIVVQSCMELYRVLQSCTELYRIIELYRVGQSCTEMYRYSTARFKLHAREYVLASVNTFSPSSQPMLASKGRTLASKGSMLSSKSNMLSCIILLAIEIEARVQLLARIRHRAVSRCTRARLHALVHYFTRDFKLDARGHNSSSIH